MERLFTSSSSSSRRTGFQNSKLFSPVWLGCNPGMECRFEGLQGRDVRDGGRKALSTHSLIDAHSEKIQHTFLSCIVHLIALYNETTEITCYHSHIAMTATFLTMYPKFC